MCRQKDDLVSEGTTFHPVSRSYGGPIFNFQIMGKDLSEQLIDMLAKAGVKRVYAVTGDSLNRVNDAVRKNDKVQWIHVRNEETGAFAAGAEAQLHGGIACCAGSSGPGHVHLINGLYDAHRSGAPVIAIASALPTEEFGTQYFQETNTIRLFDDCSFFNQVVTTSEQLPRMVQGAIQAAISQRGVAVVGLPGDVTSKATADVFSSSRAFFTRPQVCPAEEELRQLAELLNGEDKVTIFCGIGAKDAHDEVVELSHRLKAPVAYSFKSKMEIQYDNPNEIGMTGLLGMASAYESMHRCGVLLMLGTDFPYGPFLPQDNKIVQVDIKAERLGRRAKLIQGLCGDIKTTLNALLPMLKQKEDATFLKEQLLGYNRTMEKLHTYVKEQGEKDKIHPEYVMYQVNEVANSDAIFTVDTGMTCVWGARYLQASGKRRMLGSFNHGSMANALPQAIGASLAYPDRQVVALCGDGGLSMLLGDLMTVVQYKLPVKVVVFNNRSLGMVKLEMEVTGLPDNETDMMNPDFARLAESMGMKGYTVSEPQQVLPTLIEAFNSTDPVLVNVMTDPNALAMPPQVEWGQMTGFAKAMYRMLITGRGQEIIDTINSNYKHIREVL